MIIILWAQFLPLRFFSLSLRWKKIVKTQRRDENCLKKEINVNSLNILWKCGIYETKKFCNNRVEGKLHCAIAQEKLSLGKLNFRITRTKTGVNVHKIILNILAILISLNTWCRPTSRIQEIHWSHKDRDVTSSYNFKMYLTLTTSWCYTPKIFKKFILYLKINLNYFPWIKNFLRAQSTSALFAFFISCFVVTSAGINTKAYTTESTAWSLPTSTMVK